MGRAGCPVAGPCEGHWSLLPAGPPWGPAAGEPASPGVKALAAAAPNLCPRPGCGSHTPPTPGAGPRVLAAGESSHPMRLPVPEKGPGARPAPQAGCRSAQGTCHCPHTCLLAELALPCPTRSRTPAGIEVPAPTTRYPVVSWRGLCVCKLAAPAPHQALGHLWGWDPQDQPGPNGGPQRCFLVVQEPRPSVASSSFRKPNCSFIFQSC